jgi:RNA polymerase sigma-70 factor, ECF subfamily
MDDQTAIRQLKQGDLAGLAVLVERYQVESARAAYLITQDISAADDIVQEAFLRVHRHAARIDDQRPFAPYLIRIIVNLSIDSVKRREREASLEDVGAEMLADVHPTPEHLAEASELRQAVQQALHVLPPEQRAAIVLRYYFDYTEREVAEMLSLPQGTVSWRLSSARKQLSVMLRVFTQEG